MSMLTDSEQKKLLEEEDGPITKKFKSMFSEAEDRILKQTLPLFEKMEKVDEIDKFVQKVKRGFNGIVK